MKLKRILATVLCLCMVLTCLPEMGLPMQAKAAEGYSLTIEAEDTEYAVWNKYTKSESNSSASGGAMAAGGTGRFAWYDAPDSNEDLVNGVLDKTNSDYVAFYVEATEAGTYYLSTAATFWCSANYLTVKANGGTCYFAAFLVNPSRKLADPNATVAYKANYAGGTSKDIRGKYTSTDAVEVTLEKGLNVIYVLPITWEQDGSSNWKDEAMTAKGDSTSWANVDCLKITGDSQVTAVKAQGLTLNVGDAPYVKNYTATAGAGVGGASWSDRTIAIDEMTTANVDKLPYVSYTVNAPKDGYYDITAVIGNAQNDTCAVAFMVDGKAQAREYVFQADGTAKAEVDLSAYLTKGDHVITLIAPTSRTDADASADGIWCDYTQLKLYGGLTQATIMANPKMDWWYAEAEFKDEGYALWHTYSKTETNNDAKRDYANATGTVIGGGNTVYNPALATLQAGGVSKDSLSAVTIYVDAPVAGNYSFKARYRLNNPGIWDSTNKAWKAQPFGAFMVNGEACVQANFPQNAQYNWTYDTVVVEMSLYEGINEITFIPMTEDTRISGSDWANIDCVFVDTALQVVKVPSVTLKDVAPQDGAPYLYNNNNSGSVGGSQLRAIKNLKIHAGNAAENLQYIPSVSYTVDVPVEAYYTLTQYTSNYSAESAYVVFVDGKPVATRDYVVGSKILDLSCRLPKGTHTVSVTILLPKDAEAAAGFAYGWMDFYGLQMDAALTLATQQFTAPVAGMTIMEAETAGLNNPERSYSTTETPWQGSGKKVVSGAAGSSITTDEAMIHVESHRQAYIEYVVEAPAAGSYKLVAGVQIGKITDDTTRYLLMQINGKTQKITGLENDSGTLMAVPVTVELAKGTNVIRVIGATKTQTDTGLWMNQDYLAIDSRLTALSNPSAVAQADRATYWGNYTIGSGGGWDGDQLGQSIKGSFNVADLSYENFKDASWYSYTVNAPRDGYYAIKAKVWFNKMSADVAAEAAKVGMLVDGEAYALECWKTAASSAAMAEATVYLTKGSHNLIVTGALADSNMGAWVDADYLRLSGGLTVAEKQLYPQCGLVDGSVYKLSGSTLSGVYKTTDVQTLKSNFFHVLSVTDGSGKVLSDTDTVPNGAVVNCLDGTYTVATYRKGDINNDGKIDIRDLKLCKELILGNSEHSDDAMDIDGIAGITLQDVLAFVQVIFGVNKDLDYMPNSIGPEAILALCNPVGRLTYYRGAVFMEASASNFTITGDLKGDVVLDLHAECSNSYDELGIFVEVDGEVTYHKLTRGVRNRITIASDLTPGKHVIEVSKSTDAKNDSIYVYSVSYNGTLEETAQSDKYIEFLGDSITAGFGVFKNETTTKSYYSYANTVADLFDADYYSMANGGWRFGANTYAAGNESEKNNYIGYIYEKLSMQKDAGAYDFARQPDVIVINLGTNDAIQFKTSAEDFSQDVYNADVAALLSLVRKNNPNATVLWVYGAMEGSTDMQYGDMAAMLETAISAYNTASGDNVTFHNTLTANTAGKYQHPTAEAQAVNGQEVAAIISQLTGWETK